MPRTWGFRVDDIQKAIGEIKGFVEGHDAISLKGDRKTLLAVIYLLQTIGEASTHLPDEVKARCPDIEWRKIKDLRNFVVHQYFEVDERLIWKAVTEDLDVLENCISTLSKELPA